MAFGAQKHPEISLARQIEARLWRVQKGMLWSSRFDLEVMGDLDDFEQDNHMMKTTYSKH